VSFYLQKFYFLTRGNGTDGMFIDQLVSLSPENEAKVIEPENDSFNLTASG
jgi:hypothetical protein